MLYHDQEDREPSGIWGHNKAIRVTQQAPGQSSAWHQQHQVCLLSCYQMQGQKVQRSYQPAILQVMVGVAHLKAPRV